MVNNKIINKILFGLEKFNLSFQTIELRLWKQIYRVQLFKSKLSETAQDLFNFLNQFAIFYNATNNI